MPMTRVAYGDARDAYGDAYGDARDAYGDAYGRDAYGALTSRRGCKQRDAYPVLTSPFGYAYEMLTSRARDVSTNPLSRPA